jgi:hypothetical protein
MFAEVGKFTAGPMKSSKYGLKSCIPAMFLYSCIVNFVAVQKSPEAIAQGLEIN